MIETARCKILYREYKELKETAIAMEETNIPKQSNRVELKTLRTKMRSLNSESAALIFWEWNHLVEGRNEPS